MLVNRDRELSALEELWAQPGASLTLVWGRRRVGKTALLEHFSRGKRAIFHTSTGRPPDEELAVLSRAAAPVLEMGPRDLTRRPFADWDEALIAMEEASTREPLLVVLDEFPEAVGAVPWLPSILRAFWDRARSSSMLRIILCGSAVRTMEALQEQRAPLYGRMDLALRIDPLRPHEAALMLPKLEPPERALVWGIVGGVPLYLSWWDQSSSVSANLLRLAGTPGGHLLTEGQLILASEVEQGDLAQRTLRAIAGGRTRYGEIKTAVRTEPSRTLERLEELRLVERVVPVTDVRRTRRTSYRIADNLLAFWLGTIDRYRSEIERGLGSSVVHAMHRGLNDHMGPVWEEAFRLHLRRLIAEEDLVGDAVAVGAWWGDEGQDEIDAVVLAGRERAAVLVGEVKWSKSVAGGRVARGLLRKAAALPSIRQPLQVAVCARTEVRDPFPDSLSFTAEDIFG